MSFHTRKCRRYGASGEGGKYISPAPLGISLKDFQRPCRRHMVIFHSLLQVTDLLRMVCLTEDSAYLAKFLEEILEL